jgi:hypothetical protein
MRAPAWLRRRQRDRDLEKELQFHLNHHVRDLIAAGLPPPEAYRRARLELGGVDQIKERVRDARPGAWLDHVVYDVRDACRLSVSSSWSVPSDGRSK